MSSMEIFRIEEEVRKNEEEITKNIKVKEKLVRNSLGIPWSAARHTSEEDAGCLGGEQGSGHTGDTLY